jgi:hypothetical protein
MDERWNLQRIPPKGHKDTAEFAAMLYDVAKKEKERLGKPEDFLRNYALYRGKRHQQTTGRMGFNPVQSALSSVNLYFANVERTVSNITAKNPAGEVVDMDGVGDGSDQILTMELKKWWKDTKQHEKTRASARQMEIYGITIEKPTYDKSQDRPDVAITDPFAFYPAPGYWDDMAIEAPYICYVYVDYVSKIEADYKCKDVSPEDAYDDLGTVREDYKPISKSGSDSVGNYTDPMTVKKRQADKSIDMGIIVEIWVRDNRTAKQVEKVPLLDEYGAPALGEDGMPLIQETTTDAPVYRDGVRKITLTKAKVDKTGADWIVIDDCDNPNLNPALPTEIASRTYPWGRLPVYHANSYKDQVSVWGFSAAEQVADLIDKINTIISKLIAYTINVMAPPLIIQQHCGITRDMIDANIQKSGRLVLMPSVPNARIEFMQVPNLPATFFQVLNLIIQMFDRVYQIEDADRGVAPTGVVAASAIVALQERNQVLMQAKTSAIDSLAEQRSRWAIGLWQNFGTSEESVNLPTGMAKFRGVNFAGRNFNFIIESGSTTPRTSLQVEQQAKEFYGMRAIDARALLETVNFPNWKQIIERTGESQLDMALQILIQAGMPKEAAMQLKQYLMQPQGGPGDMNTPKETQPGVPRAQQGEAQDDHLPI